MDRFITKMTNRVQSTLSRIEQSESDVLKKTKKCIELLEENYRSLKEFVLNYEFKSEQEEIRFFKQIKPGLFSHLIFYQKVYAIELNRPPGGEDEQRQHLRRQTSRLNDYFEDNREFYKYYRSEDSSMDEVYFLRYRTMESLTQESFYYERDPQFSTIADFKLAKIIAIERLEKYLNEEFHKLDTHSKELPKRRLAWTMKKVFLIELIYFLYWLGVFNHGKASLKAIIAYFEEVFNIDLGANPSSSLSDIRDRKNPFPFFKMLKRTFDENKDKDDKDNRNDKNNKDDKNDLNKK